MTEEQIKLALEEAFEAGKDVANQENYNYDLDYQSFDEWFETKKPLQNL